MTVTFYWITEWFPGSKRPFCSQANMNAFLERHAVGSQSSNTWWFPNSPQDLEYIDVNGSASTNHANYIIVREMTGSGTRWGYFVTNGRSLTSGVYRMDLQYDPYISYIIQRGPGNINIRRAHIAGAGGGGLPSASMAKVPANIIPTGKMKVTTTQALNLEQVYPLSQTVQLIVAFSFEQVSTEQVIYASRRNLIFRISGDFSNPGQIIGALSSAARSGKFDIQSGSASWSDGVMSGAWYVPSGLISNDLQAAYGLLYYESSDGTKLGQNAYLLDDFSFGNCASAANINAANTRDHHCRVGNPLRSVEVCQRTWNTPVIFGCAAMAEAGVFSFGFFVDNQFVDMTETVALPYSLVTQNSGKTQRQIADTIGLIGSGAGVVASVAAAVPTGGLSLIGAVPSIASFGQQLSEKINRPTPNSAVPASGLLSMTAFITDEEGETATWTAGLCLMNYQAANLNNYDEFGYPQDYWDDFVQLSHTAPSTGKGYYIRIDQGEPITAPPEYRRGIKEQLAAGVIVYNGVPT